MSGILLRRRSAGHRAGGGGGGTETYPFNGTGALGSPWVLWGNYDTVTQPGDGTLTMDGVQNGTGNSGGAVIPMPSGDWEYEASGTMIDRDYNNMFGMVVRESATGKYLTVGVGKNFSGPGGSLDGVILVYASATSTILVRTVFASLIADPYTYSALFRISLTGSTLALKVNNEGAGWSTAISRSMATDFTTAPDQVGLFVDPHIPAGTNNVAVWDYLNRLS